MSKLAAIGIDAGSTTVKAVAVDAGGAMLHWLIEPTGHEVEKQTQDLIDAMKEKCGATGTEIPIVATGYGRKIVKAAARRVSEITCHARGVYQQLKQPGTLVDIGGQDSKGIVIDGEGKAWAEITTDKDAKALYRVTVQEPRCQCGYMLMYVDCVKRADGSRSHPPKADPTVCNDPLCSTHVSPYYDRHGIRYGVNR